MAGAPGVPEPSQSPNPVSCCQPLTAALTLSRPSPWRGMDLEPHHYAVIEGPLRALTDNWPRPKPCKWLSVASS
ncbi:hypothetical protein CgunFtcFv8_013765 [Champsocephalus gunnari]|uniref:Uncharacterized protein n=1 Tax=Champsocephalus gunnari TaxID=52237 RepID=A0AAN8E1G0_CHAGU|nr:hypothetical protein CgunFtcFv8_013765 [Champsocephalus gunnari]